jgi:ADP-glucose pyrophosphorylase
MCLGHAHPAVPFNMQHVAIDVAVTDAINNLLNRVLICVHVRGK